MPRPQFTLRALLAATLVVAAFFAGTSFGWRQREALKRDIDAVKSTVKNLKESNSALAEKLNEANEFKYRGISIQRTVVGVGGRPRGILRTEYSWFVNGKKKLASTLESAIASIESEFHRKGSLNEGMDRGERPRLGPPPKESRISD